MKYSGTISRGVRTPIIKKGDDLASIVVDSVCKAVDEAKIEINDKDVVAITEAVVGISQGNYATADQNNRNMMLYVNSSPLDMEISYNNPQIKQKVDKYLQNYDKIIEQEKIKKQMEKLDF